MTQLGGHRWIDPPTETASQPLPFISEYSAICNRRRTQGTCVAPTLRIGGVG